MEIAEVVIGGFYERFSHIQRKGNKMGRDNRTNKREVGS